MKNTIVLLTHVGMDNSPYCSYVHQHAVGLKKNGYNVIVFAVKGWAPFISYRDKEKKKRYKELVGEKSIDGVRVIYLTKLSIGNIFTKSKINYNGYFYYYRILRRFKNILKQNEILYIDAHTFKIEGFVALKLKRKFGLPTVLTIHGTSFMNCTKYPNGITEINKICNGVDRTIFVSKKLEKIAKMLGVTNSKVILNGFEIHSNLQNESLNKKKNSLLSVGNLISQKNFLFTLRVFEKIKNLFPDSTLLIIGDGIMRNELEKYCIDNCLEDVKFLGRISNEEVQYYMKHSEVFILPSINEGFGIVYLEAMFNGCITIGTKNEGIDGTIIDGENGFLIDPYDISSAVSLIVGIFNNCNEKIVISGKNTVKNLTWEYNGKQYIKCIEEESISDNN